VRHDELGGRRQLYVKGQILSLWCALSCAQDVLFSPQA